MVFRKDSRHCLRRYIPVVQFPTRVESVYPGRPIQELMSRDTPHLLLSPYARISRPFTSLSNALVWV